jgi:DDE family transposase
VRGAETVGRSSRGYNAGKRVNGRKRHIAVDTCGLLLAVLVTVAGVQDRDAAKPLLWAAHLLPRRPTGLGRLRLRRQTRPFATRPAGRVGTGHRPEDLITLVSSANAVADQVVGGAKYRSDGQEMGV